MARKNSTKPTAAPRLYRCRDCVHAHLVRYQPDNPVLAECTIRRNDLFPLYGASRYAVEVASCPACSCFLLARDRRPLIELRSYPADHA